MATGCYPGSFNPPTIAHLAIAEAAVRALHLERVDLVVSRVALAKEDVGRPTLEHRLAVLEAVAAARPWLGVALTDHQLLVDVAAGYDVLVVGADKWAQLLDPGFYGGSEAARDDAIARLPPVAVARRAPHPVPGHARVLDLPAELELVSSTAVRAGRAAWMCEEAAAFDQRTGAWSAPDRYERWLAVGAPDEGPDGVDGTEGRGSA